MMNKLEKLQVNTSLYINITDLKVYRIYTRQQKKRIFLLSHFTSLKVMIFYFLLSFDLPMNGYWFCSIFLSQCNSSKNLQIFVQNGQNHKILAQPDFQCDFAARVFSMM